LHHISGQNETHTAQWPFRIAALYLGFFQFVHNTRRRGKALLAALIAPLVA